MPLKDVSSLPELANINVPNLPFDQLSGLLSTLLSDRSPYGMSDATMHPSESNRFGVSFASNERFDNTAGTDTHAVANGFVSVTELHALSGRLQRRLRDRYPLSVLVHVAHDLSERDASTS